MQRALLRYLIRNSCRLLTKGPLQKRAQDLESSVEASTASIRAEKDAAESLAASRSEKVTLLTSELAQVRDQSADRLRIGTNWRQRSDDLKKAQMSLDADHAERIASKDKELGEVTAKITELRKEFEDSNTKIADLGRKLADSERGSQLKEGTVQRLQSELTSAKTRLAVSTSSAAPIPGQLEGSLVCVKSAQLNSAENPPRLLCRPNEMHCSKESRKLRRISKLYRLPQDLPLLRLQETLLPSATRIARSFSIEWTR